MKKVKAPKRDENGRIKDNWLTKWRSWKMARAMKRGEIQGGRTGGPYPSRSEKQRELLLQHETEIVRAWNGGDFPTGNREKELAQKYDVDLGNFQAFIRYLQNIQRLSK